jgi:hypothetical protein
MELFQTRTQAKQRLKSIRKLGLNATTASSSTAAVNISQIMDDVRQDSPPVSNTY